MNALEIKNLCKTYDGFALDNLTLELPSGCIMGLVGENGAGKSTTIKLILDMIKKDSGSIKIFGRNNQENIKSLKEDIGVVLDEAGISECLTAIQVGNIMRYTFKNWDDNVYNELLEKFDIPKKKRFKEFSKGMKMKLAISVALSHHPKLLILDEATSGLDPVIRDEITDIFSEFTRDESHSVLMSSHIVSDLEKICDYIAFLHKGKLLMCEEKDLIKEKYGMIHCTADMLGELDKSAIIGKKTSSYGTEVIVKRDLIPQNFDVSPVDIEQLFVYMIKGDR